MKKLLAVLFACLCVFSLAACADKTPSDAAGETAAPAEVTPAPSAAPSEGPSAAPSEEPQEDALAIDTESFADDGFRAYVAANFDRDGDGKLTADEIAAVTSVSVSSGELVSLQGIELFCSLESLTCHSVGLTNLDLSRNTALKRLDCSGCGLSALDLSQNTALRYLNCSNNRLTALDLSRNTELNCLICQENPLPALDLSACPALTQQLKDAKLRQDLSAAGIKGVYYGSSVGALASFDPASLADGLLVSASTTLTPAPAVVKPAIVTQPASVTVKAGESATFSVKATDATYYQWQIKAPDGSDWTDLTDESCKGIHGETLTVPGDAAHNGFLFRCLATNPDGGAYSQAAALSVKIQPAITTQPVSITAKTGDSVSFSLQAKDALRYQWEVNTGKGWVKVNNDYIQGAGTATLTLPATRERGGYQYRCRVSNADGSVYSDVVTLFVKDLPAITAQPLNVTATAGNTVSFSVGATGAQSYQWEVNTGKGWVKVNNDYIQGAESATLTLPATRERGGYQYRCRVTGADGSVCSDAATLTVIELPVITEQPKDAKVKEGKNAVFTVKATGALRYQWQVKTDDGWVKVNNKFIEGADTASMTVPATHARNGYQYRCRVSNDDGSVYTAVVTLTVNP